MTDLPVPDLTGDADPADVEEQHHPVADEPADVTAAMARRDPEAPEADALEQAEEVVGDPDEWRE